MQAQAQREEARSPDTKGFGRRPTGRRGSGEYGAGAPIRKPTRPAAPPLFNRWLVVVYLPLALLVVGFLLFVLGVLPSWGRPALFLLAVWGLVAVRLIAERKKLGVDVPLPRSLVIGLSSTVGAGVLGALFIWGGLNRLATNTGAILLFLGGVLVLTAVIAPVLKLLDVAVRAVAGRLLKEPRRQNAR